MDNCPTLLKRVCCVQYNLLHPLLKVTMAFEWCCDVPLYQNLFPSPLCMCVFVSQKKKKKTMGNCLTLFKKMCCVQYNLLHPPLKVTMAFEQSYGVPLCQKPLPSPLCVCVCMFVLPHCLRQCCVQYNLPHPPLKVIMAFEQSCGEPLC